MVRPYSTVTALKYPVSNPRNPRLSSTVATIKIPSDDSLSQGLLSLVFSLQQADAKQLHELWKLSGDQPRFVAKCSTGELILLAHDSACKPVVYYGKPGQVRRFPVSAVDSMVPRFTEDGQVRHAYFFMPLNTQSGSAQGEERVLVVAHGFDSEMTAFLASPKEWTANQQYPFPELACSLQMPIQFPCKDIVTS